MIEPNTFAGSTLDRAGHRRTDAAWLEQARADPRSRVVLATPAGIAIDADGGVPRPATLPLPETLERLGTASAEAVLLGVGEDGAALFALDAGPDGAGGPIASLRDAAAAMAPQDAGLLAYAQAILSWQRTHRFCGSCGAPTTSEDGGHMRRCTVDGTQSHPRTDPVVIAIVGDGDRVLLGRQAAWPKGRYSSLAGFVEPGESLEQAVAREIAEEAGVAVAAITYHSSQPWPFPGSLMVGFVAAYAGGELHPQDDELEDVRWFARDEVAAAAADDLPWTDGPTGGASGLLLPPRMAIARRLIESWLTDSA
jgi:NAD+ diphosphatase